MFRAPSGGVSDGPGPDAHPHHCGSSSCGPGADCPHCIPNRQEEEPRWIPDHLSGVLFNPQPDRLNGGETDLCACVNDSDRLWTRVNGNKCYCGECMFLHILCDYGYFNFLLLSLWMMKRSQTWTWCASWWSLRMDWVSALIQDEGRLNLRWQVHHQLFGFTPPCAVIV